MFGYAPWMMGYGNGWGMGLMMLVGGIFWILLLALMALAVARLVRAQSFMGVTSRWQDRPQAIDILEERYARGDINRDEYLQKKSDISARNPVS